MSIATQITRIQTDRNTIRNKMVALGLASGTDNLTTLAEAIDEIKDNGSVTVQVKEGETYTIPAGFHNGSGTVSGVAGGGNYTLQSKTNVTPTKKSQQITPDEGFYGLSDVTVAAIPDAYQDVTAVTAGAADVLTGKTIVNSTGMVIAGTMANNGNVDKTLDTTTTSYTVPQGYHAGTGTVKIVTEEKSATPTKEAQTITPVTGKVISKVTVAPIPDAYQDVTAVDAEAMHVLIGKTIVDADGTVVEGIMPNHGELNKVLDVNTTAVDVIPGYYSNGLVEISLETKTATPTKATQDITPTAGKVLSKVTVAAIPAAYQDVTEVDATDADVLAGKKIVNAAGEVVEGAMTNNGAITATIDGLTTMAYTVPKGYHDGTGTVTLTSDIEEALAAI